jgi:hypothetical protein
MFASTVRLPHMSLSHTHAYGRHCAPLLGHLALPQAPCDVSQCNYYLFLVLVCSRCDQVILLWISRPPEGKEGEKGRRAVCVLKLFNQVPSHR